jgi:formylglycine-generating enzyme required for sulfatase activity
MAVSNRQRVGKALEMLTHWSGPTVQETFKEISMKSCMPIVVAAALLLAADEPKRGTNDSPPPPGPSLANEGRGLPSNQHATGAAIQLAEINPDGNPSLAAVIPRPVLARRPASPELITTRAAGIRLTLIPTGTFRMGLPDEDADDDHKPQHDVRISAFYLGVTEVTRGQFRQFVRETRYKTEAEKDGKGGWGWDEERKSLGQDPKYTWLNPGFEQTDEHPVVNVSWNDAVAFCEWLTRVEGQTYRLPTEAEWEYACRARTTTKYFSGDNEESLASVANVPDGTARAKYPDWTWAIAARDGFVYTAPVAQFRPNAFGLYDMHGNVWEWCRDGFDAGYYKRSPKEDPRGPSQAVLRVIRGAGWFCHPHSGFSGSRGRSRPDNRASDLGFRVARDQAPR